ncbi:MAG TPA: polysaccharide deacetylase family protein [Gaiellaceae bacterium]|nr:polysaccharide deacetylase family protein [Gaiellaceae bacterium]
MNDFVVALTFDDGPAEWTEPILDTLSSEEVRATFFVIAEAVAGREAILERIVAEGHEVGNHTLSHRRLDLVSRDEIRREIQVAGWQIRDVTGALPTVFRPPGFHFNQDVLEIAAESGFPWVTLASAWTDDYNRELATEIADAILPSVRPGAIIDLHDGRPPHEAPWGAPGGTREDRWPTVTAVELLLGQLRAHYSFLTVSLSFSHSPSHSRARASRHRPFAVG